MTLPRMLAVSALVLLAWACGKSGAEDAGADTDTGTEAEPDADADGDGDGDTDTDADTDTGPAPACTYQCTVPFLCDGFEGVAHEELVCDEEGLVCCDLPPPDTDGWPDSPGLGEVETACWATAVGGTGDMEVATAVAVFPDRSTVAIGQLAGPAVFGTGQPNETTLVPDFQGITTASEGFLARYEADGTLAWARLAGLQYPNDPPAPHIDMMASAALDDGGVAVTGLFTGEVIFGQGDPGETTLFSNPADADLFLARYDASGALVWVRQALGDGADLGLEVLALPEGDLVVVGVLGLGEVVFGEGEDTETQVSGYKPDDYNQLQLFLARYGGDGTFQWVKTHDAGYVGAATLDSEGRILVAGRFWTQAVIGAGEPNEIVLEGWPDCELFGVYIAAFEDTGETAWARAVSGSAEPVGLVALDDGGSILTAKFSHTPVYVPFSEIDGVAFWDNPAYSSSFFSARLGADGWALWAERAWLGDDDSGARANGTARTPEGFAVAGTFRGAVGFGDPLVEADWMVAGAINEPFVAWYDEDGALTRVTRVADWSLAGEARDIGVLPDGTVFLSGSFYESADFGLGGDQQTTITSVKEQDGFVATLCPEE
ncbi:MAG TPA: hypothetical protein VM285_10655 [Polyangia bacterium]|nr:hypothetical protein [Polyangia bacterium]